MASQGGGKSDRVKWTKEMELVFLEILVERFRKTLTPSLRRCDWEEIDAELANKLHIRLGVERFEGGWDSASNTFTAPDHVWTAFCQDDDLEVILEEPLHGEHPRVAARLILSCRSLGELRASNFI
ncbi:hypothetical protein CDL15_Pgr006038 [Punica granatum]|uniref:Myb/SANT-like domain-containing protein n=1 Tax=Punica granatum TaxID=22663 RepID=A0A218VTR5_PUNGR|nr:hypothetical protein CDL15_Pgr006038 [Punica granatum]